MADGKHWTTENLNVSTVPSSCYEDAEKNCSRYGRLYIWESARRLIALGTLHAIGTIARSHNPGCGVG
jgi:uncharacterized protein (TIGR02145 family)